MVLALSESMSVSIFVLQMAACIQYVVGAKTIFIQEFYYFFYEVRSVYLNGCCAISFRLLSSSEASRSVCMSGGSGLLFSQWLTLGRLLCSRNGCSALPSAID